MVDLGTPEQWQQTATAVRDGVDAARSAFELVKRYCGAGQKATQEEQEATAVQIEMQMGTCYAILIGLPMFSNMETSTSARSA